MSRRTGIVSLAKALGLSTYTVSRALNGHNDVSDATRRRVLSMAARMNYSPSAIGRTLRSGKTEAIGLVLTPSRRQFVDTYFLPLLSGLDQKFKETGKSLFVTVASGDKQAIPLLEKMIRGQRVDALIVTRIRVNDPRVKFLQDSQFPFVTLGRSRDEPRYPFVDFDHRVGASLACEHLLGLGHRRIGLINTPAEVHTSQKRSEGFHECLQKAKINTPPGYELYGDYTPQSGSRLMQKLLRTLPPPTAVICGNDEMAIGAMEAVRAGGKEVGFDVSIIGCDDIPMAEIVSPPLTTFHTSFLELGVRLAELANARIEGRPNMSSLYTPKLIVRRSTGTANARSRTNHIQPKTSVKVSDNSGPKTSFKPFCSQRPGPE